MIAVLVGAIVGGSISYIITRAMDDMFWDEEQLSLGYKMLLILCGVAVGMVATAEPAPAHELYTTLKNEQGDGCCGGNDCAGGAYPVRKVAGGYEVDIAVGTHPQVTSALFPPGTVQTFFVPGNPGLSWNDEVHFCGIPGEIKQHEGRCLFIGGSV